MTHHQPQQQQQRHYNLKMKRRRNPSSFLLTGNNQRRWWWWQVMQITFLTTTFICSIQEHIFLNNGAIGFTDSGASSSNSVQSISTVFVHSFIYPSTTTTTTTPTTIVSTKARTTRTSLIIKSLQLPNSKYDVTTKSTLQSSRQRIKRSPSIHRYDQYKRSNSIILFSSKEAQNEKVIPNEPHSVDDDDDNNNDDKLGLSETTTETKTNNPNNEISLLEVDVRHNLRSALVYDPTIERYVDCNQFEDSLCGVQNDHSNDSSNNSNSGSTSNKLKQKIIQTISNAFLPEGVTDSYYKYIKWRIIQRFINANVHVFGTQSLLMGLGKQNRKLSTGGGASALGLSAVFNWVLKDALGKIVRMLWASRMGRKFDPDAKRWRFRSSLLFAIGNGLEVMTYVYPSLFLLLATMANACKQMGMLTSSATRNALYNSFRDGTRENIGDITAKGEAQIAIVDLMGIVSGVCLSKTIGTSVQAVFSIWILLQVLEVFCVYKEIRAVVFKMLNFERLWLVVNKFIENFNERDFLNGSAKAIPLPTPSTIANNEKIFFPPNHLARRAISFGSLSRAKLSPDELSELFTIFKNEKYILVVGQDLKNKRIKWDFRVGKDEKEDANTSFVNQMKIEAQENCHIVLHADATNSDIVKSTLALAILRRKLANSVVDLAKDQSIIGAVNGEVNGSKIPSMNEHQLADFVKTRRSRDSFDLLRESREETDRLYGPFLKVLSAKGWATPARFMFGRVSMRTEWPILKK